MDDDGQFLTVVQLARKLGRSTRTIYRGLAKGEIPGVKVRSNWLCPAAYLKDLEKRAMQSAVSDQ